MASRSVGLSAMFGWIADTFRLIGRDVGAFMGASAMSMVAYILLFLPLIGYSVWPVLSGGGAAGSLATAPLVTGGTTYWVLYGVTVLASIVVLAPIGIGWFRLCRAVDRGQPGRAFDVLAPFRDSGAWIRALVTGLLMLLLTCVVVALLAAVFWSSFEAVFAQVAAQQAATLAGTTVAPQAPTAGFFIGYLVFLVLMVVLQFAYMVAFADVSLRPSSPVAAMRDAFAGVARNAHKLLVFLFCIGLVAVVAMVLLGLVLALLVAALSMLGTTAAVIGMLLLYVPFLLLMYPVMFAGSYFVWKSMVGDAAPPAALDADPGLLPA